MTDLSELPEVVRIFPLPNVVLFPHVELPLHIFEPRYREMVEDAMAGDRRIGMVLLRGDWRRDYHGAPEIFPLGCVGRIETFTKLPDGRSNLLLRGERRFNVRGEIEGRVFRQARVEWLAEEGEPAHELSDVNLRLKGSVSRLLARRDRELPPDLWQKLPRETELLVNTLASVLDLAAIEKLALLECGDVRLRADRLLEILDFHLAGNGPFAAGAGDEEPRH